MEANNNFIPYAIDATADVPNAKKILEEINEDVNVKHSRFRDAKWYGTPKDIIIGGAGGIGSWTALFLSRIGHNLIIFDFDTYDETNVAGQFCRIEDEGESKNVALLNNLREFCGYGNNILIMDRYEGDISSPIMISGFDNMKARKLMFEAWKKQEDREIFIDGRLSAEIGVIFTVVPGREAEYEATLFNDDEVEEAPCSYKATSHCGAMIGSLITSTFNNWLYNKNLGTEIRIVPFRVTFELPLINFTVND